MNTFGVDSDEHDTTNETAKVNENREQSAYRRVSSAAWWAISRPAAVSSSRQTCRGITKIMAEVPLAETFGYATDLPSMSKGQGTFIMERAKSRPVPANIQTEVIAELQPA